MKYSVFFPKKFLTNPPPFSGTPNIFSILVVPLYENTKLSVLGKGVTFNFLERFFLSPHGKGKQTTAYDDGCMNLG